MKKSYKIEVDCANCAAKMECAIKKVEGVSNANVNFMMQKMTVEADDAEFDAVMKKVVKLCRRIEPDMSIKL